MVTNWRRIAITVKKLFKLEVARGFVPDVSPYNKFGANTDIDTGTAPEDVWATNNTYTEYTGFNATAGEAIETLSSSLSDVGTLTSSGTSTGGSSTTLIDTGATFLTDVVVVGDIILNDDDDFTGIVSAVTSETVLTVIAFCDGSSGLETTYSFSSGKAYRVVTTGSTGAAVIQLKKMLESDYSGYINEYIILNGNTTVDTVGTDYLRCSRSIVLLSGSNGSAVGDIQSRQTTTTANVFSYIVNGEDQSLVACDTVPAGMTLYITDLTCKMARTTGADGSAEIDFKIRRIGTNTFNVKVHEYISNADGFKSGADYILGIPAYSDFKWHVQAVSDNNSQFSAQINGYMITN